MWFTKIAHTAIQKSSSFAKNFLSCIKDPLRCAKAAFAGFRAAAARLLRVRDWPVTKKVTLWYSVFLIAIFALLLAVVFVSSERYAYNETKAELQKQVEKIAAGEEEYKAFDDGLYAILYSADGKSFQGSPPRGFDPKLRLQELDVRESRSKDKKFIYFDSRMLSGPYQGLWLRGVTSVNSLSLYSGRFLFLFVILGPLFILIVALGGYRIIRKAFRPIQEISATALIIGREKDLSRRIELDEGNDEIHQMARAFNLMLEQLEVSYEREKQFTSDVSHELRTPISVILSESEYGEKCAAAGSEEQEAFTVISRQSQRMTKLIKQLLDMARMEQTELFSPELLDLSALSLETLADLDGLAAEKGIRLEKEVEAHLHIYGNRDLLARLIDNLLANAFKYTADHIRVALYSQAQFVCLEVADNGPGIAEEERDKVWNRFYQAESSRNKEQHQGFGLGLSFVAAIAKLHHAAVELDSAPGRGSLFRIKFARAA